MKLRFLFRSLCVPQENKCAYVYHKKNRVLMRTTRKQVCLCVPQENKCFDKVVSGFLMLSFLDSMVFSQ